RAAWGAGRAGGACTRPDAGSPGRTSPSWPRASCSTCLGSCIAWMRAVSLVASALPPASVASSLRICWCSAQSWRAGPVAIMASSRRMIPSSVPWKVSRIPGSALVAGRRMGPAETREGARTREAGRLPQLPLDPQELVVLGDAVAARGGAGFDLARFPSDREVRDGGVLGLAGAVADDRRVAAAEREPHGLRRLGQGADLVHLDEDGVGDAEFDAP